MDQPLPTYTVFAWGLQPPAQFTPGLVSINFDQLIHFQADLPLIKVSFSVHEWNGFSAARSPEHKYPQMQKLKSVFKMFQFSKYPYYQYPQLQKRKKL